MIYIDLSEITGIKLSAEEIKAGELFRSKLEEYKRHFGDIFAYGDPNLDMTNKEIIENIDKCIKYDRKWVGFIVPEEDFSDPNIMY